MKHIDSEKLLDEIKIIQQSLESRDVRLNQVKKIRTECLMEFCKCIIDVIKSLQQEQSNVDLEKEMDTYFETMEVLEHENIFEDTFQRIAKHFFELGLKAQQS